MRNYMHNLYSWLENWNYIHTYITVQKFGVSTIFNVKKSLIGVFNDFESLMLTKAAFIW